MSNALDEANLGKLPQNLSSTNGGSPKREHITRIDTTRPEGSGGKELRGREGREDEEDLGGKIGTAGPIRFVLKLITVRTFACSEFGELCPTEESVSKFSLRVVRNPLYARESSRRIA